MCSKSVVYGTKKLKGGKEQVKARDWKKKGEFKLREGVQNQPFSNMGYSDTHDTHTYIHNYIYMIMCIYISLSLC